jgi:hypothetical protein
MLVRSAIITLVVMSIQALPAAVACGRQDEGVEMSELIPMACGTWLAEDEGQPYDRESIFQYMDGAGEIYLSYDYRRMFVRTFVSGDSQPIYVELYDMGGPADAFGIFTRNRQGGDTGIGQGSEYDSGFLMFWRGRYFCSVYAIDENEESKRAVMEIGRSIAEAIGPDGRLPALLALLPETGRRPWSESYFHLHTCLNHHYYISDENILGLGHDTEAAMAEYDGGAGACRLMVVRYPSAERVLAAHSGFMKDYLEAIPGDDVREKEAGKWSGALVSGKHLLIVLDAPSRQAAETALGTMANRTGEEER